jgi:hypothetical protein
LARVSATTTPAAPITATGTASRNIDGQAIAITVFSTIRPLRNLLAPIPGRAFLPLLFAVTRRVAPLTATLRQLSFIHFARWAVITKLPYNGPPQRQGRLRYPHMYFESNFNGGWEEYIDAFSHILTRGMTAFWGSSYGFPKPLPTGQFKKYIQRHEMVASHFYSAYPEATTTIVLSALDLDRELRAFRERTSGMPADAFARAWRDFLTEVQAAL